MTENPREVVRPRCKATAKNGQPCRGVATMPDGCCPWHSTAIPDAVKYLRRQKGGLASRPSTIAGDPTPEFASPEDAIRYVQETAGMVTRGELAAEIAVVRLRAVEVFLKIFEAKQINDKLAALEALAGQKLERKWG